MVLHLVEPNCSSARLGQLQQKIDNFKRDISDLLPRLTGRCRLKSNRNEINWLNYEIQQKEVSQRGLK